MFFEEIESRFSILDAIPESIYLETVTHSHGDLIPRVHAILQWRESLLTGRLPEEYQLEWPEAFIKRTVLMRLQALNIAQYCSGQETLTDSILKDILEGISSADDYFSHKPGGFVDKLAQRQQINSKDSSFKDEEGLADHVQSSNNSAAEFPHEQQQTHKTDTSSADNSMKVSNDAAETGTGEDEGFNRHSRTIQNEEIPFDEMVGVVATELLEKNWQELAESWHELSSVYKELGGLLGRGWDLSQGVLASEGWRDIIRYRKLLKQKPELQQLMAALGRLKDVVGEESIKSLSEQVFNPIKRQITVEQETWSDRAAMETGGIVLSDDLSRLLPSELAQLGHPKLKMLWYAKRAERKLLTYCHCGLMPDPMQIDDEVEIEGPPQQQSSSQAYGPIIICLDTSASMEGAPETIAKALVLEGLRIAFNEQRPCYVYAFGGPHQVLEHELDLTRGGLTHLLKFLQQSFHGGTDVVQPLLQALEKQKADDWKDADILLITDGRFPLQTNLFDKIEKLRKQQGLRLHGLLLGNWKSRAIEQLCDPLHVYADWAFANDG